MRVVSDSPVRLGGSFPAAYICGSTCPCKSRIGPEIPKTRVLFDVDQGHIEEDENQEDIDDDE